MNGDARSGSAVNTSGMTRRDMNGRTIVVVKLGGRTQADPALPGALAGLWRSTSGALVVVHGGGDQISVLQRLRGEEPVFVGGRRVTSAGDIELIRMVLSGSANKQLVASLNAAGVPTIGISGEDGRLLTAVPIDVDVFGYAGTPHAVDTAPLHALWSSGFLPMVSPVAANAATNPGGALNVNGDDAAAAIAVALDARELFLMVDVAGVLDADKHVLARLSLHDARALVAHGVAGGGMAAKLEACERALNGGVTNVRVGDLSAMTNPALGTTLHHEPTPVP
jgi:acetylglutamate kinase